ncbi:hypothetical protein FA95DRAFT_653434 [Auriscalpium vulgare]|uniref:Uncharacterized protein n=1 Tax=Auriscalpium vulgare TaxID=40419 RepID=A0ACB8RCJ5_9AGAM|nr:hypothetical protein FA95DRAFT_653434 [Auriscalpium vulgare]
MWPHRSSADLTVNDVAVLELCPTIDDISIVPDIGLHAASQSELVERLLHSISKRPVFLSLSGHPIFVERIIHIWPTIRHLDLRLWRTASWAKPLVNMPCRLHTLAATANSIPIEWSAPAAVPPALCDLEIWHIDWDDGEQCAALVSLGVLTRLRTLVVDGLAPAPAGTVLAGLETLVLTKLPEQACVLPHGLCHLGYHFNGRGEERVSAPRLLVDAARVLPEVGLRFWCMKTRGAFLARGMSTVSDACQYTWQESQLDDSILEHNRRTLCKWRTLCVSTNASL